MMIAVLGWGSLVWDPAPLHIVGRFVPTGPFLPVEFTRISRNKRLTLVIDEAHGCACQTYSAQSKFADLDAALRDLWLRETRSTRQPPEPIRESQSVTWIDVANGQFANRADKRPRVRDTIAQWAREENWDAVIWTALGPKFKDVLRVQFSVDAAMGFLAGLKGEEAAKAFNYIRRAPAEIQTPLRAAFDKRWPKPTVG
jgi:hypothetical protein